MVSPDKEMLIIHDDENDKERKIGWRDTEWLGKGRTISKVIREGFYEEVAFQLKPERWENPVALSKEEISQVVKTANAQALVLTV